MSTPIVSIIGLVLVFILSTVFNVNMGAVAFVAAFVVGAVIAGESSDDTLAEGFPSDLFVVLVGVTYLFALAHRNGTVDYLAHTAVRAVRGRVALIPWVIFAVTAVLAAAGAPLVALIAIIAPVALGLARQYEINPLLMGLMVINGGGSGGFAPTSVLGSLTNTVIERNGLPTSPLMLFLAVFAYHVLLGCVVFVVFGGRRLLQRGAGASPSDEPERLASEPDTASLRPTPRQVITLIGLATLGVGSLVFSVDIGVLALSIAVVLSFVSPSDSKAAVQQVAWSTVLLVCGVLTYVELLQRLGTIEYLGESVVALGVPLLAGLIVCVIGAVTSAFASTIGTIGALIPLAMPLLSGGSLNPTALVIALCVSSLVVDSSPLSSSGALVVANTEEKHRDLVFRRLLQWGGTMIVVAPLTTWLLFVLPS